MGVGPGDDDLRRVARIVGHGLDDGSVRAAEDGDHHVFPAEDLDGLHAVQADALWRLEVVVGGVGVTHLHGPRVVRSAADDDGGNAGHGHARDIQPATPDRALGDDGRNREAHLGA